MFTYQFDCQVRVTSAVMSNRSAQPLAAVRGVFTSLQCCILELMWINRLCSRCSCLLTLPTLPTHVNASIEVHRGKRTVRMRSPYPCVVFRVQCSSCRNTVSRHLECEMTCQANLSVSQTHIRVCREKERNRL